VKGFIAKHKFLFTATLSGVAVLLYFARPRLWLEPRREIEGSPMNLVYVFAASKSEARSVQQLMMRSKGDPPEMNSGRVGKNEVVLFVTGIGPKAARSSAASVLNPSPATTAHTVIRRPDAVVVMGICGSLTPSVAEGEVTIYSECLSTEKGAAPLRCTAPLVKPITSLLSDKGISCRPAVGIASARVATTKSEKLALAKSGAEVVDMESYEVVAAANQAALPVVVIRVVSDSLDRRIPDFNLVLQENGEINSLNLLKVAIGSPILTAKALAASRRALGKLKTVLAVVLADEAFSKGPLEAILPSGST
jgi:nucleoside phosphorylase